MTQEKIKIIYLLGSGHCGSTLLDLIMDGHSKVVGVGEMENMPLEINKQQQINCACGQSVAKCKFWSRVLDNVSRNNNLKIYQPKFFFLLNRKKFFSSDKNSKKKLISKFAYLALNKQIYQKIKKISGKEIVFDSSKRPDRVELLALDSNFEITIIHLVRDGRGVTYSYYRKYGGFLKSALHWVLTNIKIEIFKRRHKNLKQILVRYEDFVRQPEQVLRKILNNLGLDFEPAILDFRNCPHHQVAGNRMCLGRSSEIKEDLNWRRKIPLTKRIIFSLLFSWLNYYYKKSFK